MTEIRVAIAGLGAIGLKVARALDRAHSLVQQRGRERVLVHQQAQCIAHRERSARLLARRRARLPAVARAFEAGLRPAAEGQPAAVQVVVDEHADHHDRIALEVIVERGLDEQSDLVEPVARNAVVQDAVRAAELALLQVVLEARQASAAISRRKCSAVGRADRSV